MRHGNLLEKIISVKRTMLLNLYASCEPPVEAHVVNAVRAENWRLELVSMTEEVEELEVFVGDGFG